MDYDTMTPGEIIKALRLARGIGRSDLVAKVCEIYGNDTLRVHQLDHVESGAKVYAHMLVQLLAALDLPADEEAMVHAAVERVARGLV